MVLARQLFGDPGREPAVTMAAVSFEGHAALVRQLDKRAPPVARVRTAADEAISLEVAHRLRHRLRPHTLRGGEVADTLRASTVEPPEHGAVGQRKAVLLAEATNEMPENDA